MRGLLAAVIVPACVAAALAEPQQRFNQMKADELYTAYRTGGPTVLEDAFPNVERFEAFRKDFRERVLTMWEAAEREPRRAMYMLDIALATEGKRFQYWSDFLLLGQSYLRQRPEPPGVNPRMDAFELLWNKTALAYLDGRRQPELVEELLKRLPKRIVTTPPVDRMPALVDPWIAVATGFMHEGYVIADATRFASRIPRALESYAEAEKHETTRAEALVRAAGLEVRSGRPADALARLERFDGATDDPVLVYWARLLRGKALDALEHSDESIAAYQDALAIAPSAQSPLVGMMMAESRRGRDDAAEALARRVRTAPDPVNDPWWIYPHGELRVFHSRLAELRDLAR